MDAAPDEAEAATVRAQALVAAARSHHDASFAAGLAVSFAADSPAVKAWLYGATPDPPPIRGTRALAYRSVFDGQPASQLSVVGEAKVATTAVPSYVLGTVLATTDAHPFASMGAAVSGLPFAERTSRRRFAIRICAPAFQRVEVARLVDGGLITHERCIVRCVTSGGEEGSLHHEVVTWHHRTVVVPDEMPAPETAALRLLQRCSRRREPCVACAPSGVPILQPCPHVVARARGVVFSRGWDDYVDLLIATPVGGTAHFELQQPATAAATKARSLVEPAVTPIAADPDAMALSVGAPVGPPGSSTDAEAVAPASSVTQGELDAASAVLPPVTYECEHFVLESPQRFFNTTLRQAAALAEAYPMAAGQAARGPADTTAASAVADAPAGGAGGTGRRSPPRTAAGARAPTGATPTLDTPLAVGLRAVAEPAAAVTSMGASVAGHPYRGASAVDVGVGSTDVAAVAAGIGVDPAAARAAVAAPPSRDWLPGRGEEQLGQARQTEPASSAMEHHPLQPTLFPIEPSLGLSQVTPPSFPPTTPQLAAPQVEGTAPPTLRLPLMPSAASTPWVEAGQVPVDTVMRSSTAGAASFAASSRLPPAGQSPLDMVMRSSTTGAASSAASSRPAPPEAPHGASRGLASSPPRLRLHMCEQCGSSFSSASDLARHVTTVHDRVRRWPCPVPECRFVGLQRGHLTTHTASVHATERPYVCQQCPPGPSAFRGVTRSAVQRHTRRVHEGVRPYACVECTSTFASTSDLTRHRRRLHGAIISTRAEALRAREEAMAAAKARRGAATTSDKSEAGSTSAAIGGTAAASLSIGRSSESEPSTSAVLSSLTGPMSSGYGAASATDSTPLGAVGRHLAAAPTSTGGMPSSAAEYSRWGPASEPALDDGGTWPSPTIPPTIEGVLGSVATAAPFDDPGIGRVHDSAERVSDWQRQDSLPAGRSLEGVQAADTVVAMGVEGAVTSPPALGRYSEAPDNGAATGVPAVVGTAAVEPPRAPSEGGALPGADTERRVGCLPVRRMTREQDGSSSCCFWPRHSWNR